MKAGKETGCELSNAAGKKEKGEAARKPGASL